MAVRLKMIRNQLLVIFSLILYFMKVSCVKGWTEHGYNFVSSTIVLDGKKPVLLIPGEKYIKNDTRSFHIYCFESVPKSVLQIWRSVQLVLLDVPKSYEIFQGVNETEVYENYNSKSILFHTSTYFFFSSDSIIDFPAFSNYCVGIAASEKYSFFLKVRIINYWKVLQFLIGIFLFLSSPELSRNSFFHYASGVTFGVLASFLILLYVFSRFIPQKTASYAVLVFGYSFILYFLKMVCHHFHDIMTQYMDLVLSYLIVTAFLSFLICYRIGPIRNERTHNIIQWLMQTISLVLIFFSSEYRELSTAVILLLLTIRMIPASCIQGVKFLWYKCFPPKLKFLTELEYIEQGHVETKKALDNLRKYCSSPDCNVWKMVRNLKDPVRFANFIETGNHYTDEELLDYNSEDFSECPGDSDIESREDTYI